MIIKNLALLIHKEKTGHLTPQEEDMLRETEHCTDLARLYEEVVFREEWKLYVSKIQTLNCRIN